MRDQVEQLLEILFDKTAREDERHDAAMCLYDYDDPRVTTAFFKIGTNENELIVLLDAAGEGIGELWSKKNKFDFEKLKTLTEISRDAAIATIKHKNPKLLKMKI